MRKIYLDQSRKRAELKIEEMQLGNKEWIDCYHAPGHLGEMDSYFGVISL